MLLFTVLLIVTFHCADWSTPQLTKHKHEIESQLGNYFLRVASPKIFARSLLFSSGKPSSRASDMTLGASGGESVSVWDGLPEDLKALFTTHAPRSTTTSDLEEDNPRESNDGVSVKENENVDPNHALLKLTLTLEGNVDRYMERLEAGLALNEVMSVLKMVRIHHVPDCVLRQLYNIPCNKQANKTLTDIAPWSPTTSLHLVHTTRIVALETLRVVGRCLAPVMPGVGAKLSEALGGKDVGVGNTTTSAESGKTEAEKEMERFWRRWSGRDVKGVKLF